MYWFLFRCDRAQSEVSKGRKVLFSSLLQRDMVLLPGRHDMVAGAGS